VQAGRLTSGGYFARRAAEIGRLLGAPRTWPEVTRAMFETADGLAVRPAARALVADARAAGLRTGVLTSKLVAFLSRAVIERSPFLSSFDVLLDESETGVAKPDPAAYTQAAAAMGLDPAAVLFVDDDPANVAGAEAAGMAAEAFDVTDPARSFTRLRRRLALPEAPPPAPTRVAYGPGTERSGELWRPAGDGPWPVVVLLHGGFWRARWTLELMRPLAADLAGRGLAAWNLEYRRAGQPGGGWPGTLEDVAAGIDHLAALAARERLDLDRLAVAGHSAGGQLALWAAARPGLPAGAPGAGPLLTPRLVVSLAGVCDLHAGAADGIGEDAVAGFLGAGPGEAPDRYRLASPRSRLPLGVRQVLVHGDADPRVPVAQSRAYAAAAAAAGDPVELLELPGVDHFALIDPATPAWAAAAARLDGFTGGLRRPG
jgi:acetyl esterase/lipase